MVQKLYLELIDRLCRDLMEQQEIASGGKFVIISGDFR